MKEQLKNIKISLENELKNIQSTKEIENIKVKYTGRKSELSSILKQISTISKEERPEMGRLINETVKFIEQKIKITEKEILQKEQSQKIKSETIDVTIPGKKHHIGTRHPLSIVLNEVQEIFLGMGFSIAQGPEIEYCYNNFDALNIPKDHPSRDEQDTFYINDDILLRTQTSPVQVRVMKSQKPPIRIISPGRVYRSDAVDATHLPMFHQVEGLVIDKGVSFSELKWTLETFIKRLYGSNSEIRFRPHHFPFTEPSAEVDIKCFNCGGKGCSLCKGEGFIEVLGCGMVHPKVLENCGIDPEKYSGFALGLGLERIVMFRYSTDDLRLFYENDIRFLQQF